MVRFSRFGAVLLMILGGGVLFAQSASRGLSVVSIPTEQGEVELYNNSHALIVANSDYTAGWPDLPGVVDDAEEVAAALSSHGFDVTVALDQTSAEIDATYRNFINLHGQDPQNRLLFFYAGHGYTQTLATGLEMGYIVPVDSPNPNVDQTGFNITAMDMQQIEVYAKRIQSKHAMFLFDSCFSGSIFSLSRAIPENISYKTSEPVRQFITAGNEDQEVPDDSVFADQFVRALEGDADSNDDGFLTGTELGEYLQSSVINYTRNAQTPQYGKIRDPLLDRGDFVFAFEPPEGEQTVAEEEAEDEAIGVGATVRERESAIGVERATGGLRVVTNVAGVLRVGGAEIGEVVVGEELDVSNLPVGVRRVEVVTSDGTISAEVRISSSGVATVTIGDPPEPEPETTTAGSSLVTDPEIQLTPARQTYNSLTTAGWISMGAGAASAVVGAIGYFLGAEAYEQYNSATTSSAADAARADLDTFTTMFSFGLGVGGVGIALGPILWLLRPQEGAPDASPSVTPLTE